MLTCAATNLYKQSRDLEFKWFQAHREYARFYFTIISAIGTGAIYALHYGFNHLIDSSKIDKPLLTLASIGCLILVAYCIMAIKDCGRAYRRALEECTIQAKLEDSLAFSRDTPSEDRKFFSEDTDIISYRWAKDRKDYKSSKKFIEDRMKKGSHLFLKIMLIIFALFFLGLAIITVTEIINPSTILSYMGN